jgi:hypothetical protein
MSWEEDFLMGKVRDLEARVADLERKVDGSWDGSSSPTSTEPPQTSTPSSGSSPQPPAPTTGSPSNPDPEGSSTAVSTGGSGLETPKAYAAKPEWVQFVTANGWPADELGDPAERTKTELIAWWDRR